MPFGPGFCLIDRIISIDTAARMVVVESTYSGDELLDLADHFPDAPIQPGSVLVEKMLQACVVLATKIIDLDDRLPVVLKVEATFKRFVLPGDIIRIEAQIIHLSGSHGKATATATVKGEVVCTAKILFGLKTKDSLPKRENILAQPQGIDCETCQAEISKTIADDHQICLGEVVDPMGIFRQLPDAVQDHLVECDACMKFYENQEL